MYMDTGGSCTPQPGSLRRSLSIASLIMMVSVLLSRVLGVVREQILAYAAGAGSEMDAYQAAFLLPEVVNHLLASGVMSITFIPIFHRHLADGDEKRAWQAFSNILSVGTVVLFVLVSLCMVLTPELLGLMGEQIRQPEQLARTVRMTRIVLPAQFFMYWGTLLMAVQFARKRFLVPALAPLIYNIGIIAGGLLLSRRMGVEGFAWGVLGGAIVGNYLLQVVGAAQAGMDFRPRIDLRDPDLRTYVFVTLPLVLGAGMQFSNEVLFRVFGSFLAAGSIACLGYATKVFMALNGVFGQAIGAATFPFLSQLAAEHKLDEMNHVAHRVIGRIAVLVLPCAAVLMVVARPVVSVLFERGRFGAEAAQQTSLLLTLYLVGAFGFAAYAIVVRCFYALQNTLMPMVVSTVVVAVMLPVYWLMGRWIGSAGVALAGAISMNLMLAAQFVMWFRRTPDVAALKELGLVCAKVSGAAVAGALVAWGIREGLCALGTLESMGVLWGNLTVALVAGGVSLAGAFMILDVLGLVGVRAAVRRFLNRGGLLPQETDGDATKGKTA